MAEVCLTASSVLSPISPNENRKRRHGHGSDAGDGCGGSWFKRHRTGSSFARRLLHLRGFSVDARQAEDLVRFIDQLPQEMEKDVSSILDKCGDIDDAIQQLTSLKLTFQQTGGDAKAAPVEDAGAGVAPETTAAAPILKAAAASGLGAAGVGAGAHPQPAVSAAPACVLSQEWVTALVQEMSAAANVPDAHNRATRVLQAFETAVRDSGGGRDASGGGGAGETGMGPTAKAHAENLARENVILKRAVTIQNARQQEQAQVSQQQISQLQRTCAQYQEQLQQVQRQNYSLGLHLKEAMSPSPSNFNNRNPDVF